jgi:SAM-dependent methyltransferase
MTLPESPEPEAFKDFEHERWQSAARVYHREFGRLTSQIAPFLLDAAGVKPGVRALDIASGPGYIAALASRRGANVTGSDFSSEMVALAREAHPGVTFQAADAEALPFGDRVFETATMGFLLGHLPRPAVAVREAWRVLEPGGRLALSWWQPPARCVAFSIMSESVRVRGRVDVGLPAAPPFELFGEPSMLRTLLIESGFSGVQVNEVPMVWKLGSADQMFDAYLNGTARTAGLLLKQTPEALDAIRREVGERCRPFRKGNGLELPMPAHVASGVKL